MNQADQTIRVMLVDDHALVRMGFRMLLADAKIEVAAEADTGEQACQDYPQVRPDLVVMDLSMPGIGQLEALRRLLAHDPKARVLALSATTRTRSIPAACCALAPWATWPSAAHPRR